MRTYETHGATLVSEGRHRPRPSIPRQQRIRLKVAGAEGKPVLPFPPPYARRSPFIRYSRHICDSALRIDHRMYAISQTLATAHRSVACRIFLWNVFCDVWVVLHPYGRSPPLQSAAIQSLPTWNSPRCGGTGFLHRWNLAEKYSSLACADLVVKHDFAMARFGYRRDMALHAQTMGQSVLAFSS